MFNRIQEARIKLAKKILPAGWHVSKNNPKGKARKPKLYFDPDTANHENIEYSYPNVGKV